MPECYIRGSTIKYLRIPDEVIDMVKEETMVKGRGRGEMKGRGGQGQRGRGGGRGTSFYWNALFNITQKNHKISNFVTHKSRWIPNSSCMCTIPSHFAILQDHLVAVEEDQPPLAGVELEGIHPINQKISDVIYIVLIELHISKHL
jgi:hypothetical protein